MNRFLAAGGMLALGLLAAATAQPAQAEEGLLKLRVCNRSSDAALVAISYVPVGSSKFRNEGWFRVNPGECKQLAETDNATWYGYADVVGKDRHWGGNWDLCVQYPGPYDFWSTGSEYCESWQEVRGFVVMTAKEGGDFTWNLDP